MVPFGDSSLNDSTSQHQRATASTPSNTEGRRLLCEYQKTVASLWTLEDRGFSLNTRGLWLPFKHQSTKASLWTQEDRGSSVGTRNPWLSSNIRRPWLPSEHQGTMVSLWAPKKRGFPLWTPENHGFPLNTTSAVARLTLAITTSTQNTANSPELSGWQEIARPFLHVSECQIESRADHTTLKSGVITINSWFMPSFRFYPRHRSELGVSVDTAMITSED